MTARVTFQSGEVSADLAADLTALQVLKKLDVIRGAVVAARVNGQQWDLDRPVSDAADQATTRVRVEPIYADTDEGRFILRHSTAHIMAQAVTELFPEAQWGIGPPVEDGFYYDFDVDRPFTGEDLDAIEDRMKAIMGQRQTFEREVIDPDVARAEFADQRYKLEIIDLVASGEIATSVDAPDGSSDDAEPTFTVYRNVRPDGEVAWSDLCRGPHVPSSERIPAFKLLRSAGAYWRGSEANPMLQRIYGTAWESNKALKAHLTMLEEAAERDHRKLGRELELTHFSDELGPGLSIFLPKGAMVRKQMEDWIRDEVLSRGYEAVYTPHIAKEQLWQISGHLQNYGELMYPGMEIDDDTAYRLKPMNCPFHIMAYQSRTRSYRDLPIRLSELGTVYRYERSGVVNGQLRARGLTQDDSHIFCREDQVVDEVTGCVDFALDLYEVFGFGQPSRIAISTRPDKSIGSDAQWEVAEQALIDVVESSGLDYEIDPGEGAFYGPKIDIHLRDAIGREWQTTTVQLDFNLPQRFGMTYVGSDGEHHQPFMVHRALFGSIERFFAVLLESTNGAFPTWLAPVQTIVIPVAADFDDYAQQVAATLRAERVRVEVDTSDDTLGNKVRRAATAKVPYALIVGQNEQDASTVSVRPYQQPQDKDVPIADFVARVTEEISEKTAVTHV